MPGDTLVIAHKGDSLTIADSLFYRQTAVLSDRAATDSDESSWILLPVLLATIVSAFVYTWLKEKIRKIWAVKAALADMRSNFEKYDLLIASKNGYYRSLPDTLRKRFVERVVWFTSTKTFTCIDLQPDEKMPLLISAAAVQISFGLDKYLLDFFNTVYILQRNYNYGLHQKPFEGHVSAHGIYLSWDNFIKGYDNYSDGDNVGIHEMAHALAYVNFMAGENDGQDEAFIQRFYCFSTVARPIFNDMQDGKTNMLNGYAASNYNEFWAVAVEAFFEKSAQMKIELPHLYSAICSLLNQDPLLPGKILQDTGLYS